MKRDIGLFKDRGWALYICVAKGVTCHQCGSGEVRYPMQTADLPTIMECLRCGTVDPASDFKHTGGGDA